jgi:RNA polymerase sigma factor (sigma-70 family)
MKKLTPHSQRLATAIPASQSNEGEAVQSSGKPDVLSQLFARESDFRAFLRRRISDDAFAEDLLQQSFMRAVQQEHQLEQPEQVVAWFYRILRNATVDYYRARAADDRKMEAFIQEFAVTGTDKTPALDELRPTVCACLQRLLPALRPAYANLLNRIDIGGESPASVAKDLGVTPNNLTVRLHRARQALRKGLEESCGICTKHGCLNCTCDEAQ